MKMEIKVKISVDKSTAETCLKLVETFINDNSNFDIITDKMKDGTYRFHLVDTGGGNNGCNSGK